MKLRRLISSALVLVTAAGAVGACGGDEQATSSQEGNANVTLRLGYFPNVTHATAIVGIGKGIFRKALGADVTLEPKTFNAGPAAVEALFAEGLDATYIGPSPAINAFVKSNGEAIRIISGATSGGAALVTRPSITSVAQLKGKKVASPQLGNTQDVALRAFLASKGLKTDPQGGGDVSIVPQENAQTLETFKSGDIDGAWVPEPWVTRLVLDGGGKVLVDEKTLWPGGDFVTTHLVVRTAFLERHPEVVARLLRGQIEADKFVNENPSEAQTLANTGIEKLTGKKLATEVISGAWANLRFTNDPIASSLATSAKHGESVGLLEKVDLRGIYALGPLNKELKQAGLEAVSDR